MSNSMTFRAIDGLGDWQFGNGRGSYFKTQAAIAANVKTRLLLFLGEAFWSLQSGVDWWNLLGSKNPQAQANIIIQTRAVLAGAYGVIRINSVVPSVDTSTRTLTIAYNVDTIYTRNFTQVVPITF